MNWKKSVVLKKAYRFGFDALRPLVRPFSNGPIVMANSFPKSGTHLLLQVLEAFSLKDYGNFLASTPSITMIERHPTSMVSKIDRLVPGELVSAHMFHNEIVNEALKQKEVTHFFIYRDPRDVIVSECYYLSEMNKWHKLYQHFSQHDNISDMIEMSINGINTDDFYYPDIGTRMSRYTSWIVDDNVLAIKFEDLTGPNQKNVVTDIVNFFATKNHSISIDVNKTIDYAIQSIAPEKSHTFRSGKSGKWKDYFSDKQTELMARLASNELKTWGYE